MQLANTKVFTLDEIRWELETEHGFTSEEIPALLGGLWTYDAHNEWLKKRIVSEQSWYFTGNRGDVFTQQDNQNNNDNKAGLFVESRAGVTYDSRRHGRGHYRSGMGPSSKRSKRDKYPPQWMSPDDDSEGEEDEAEDGKPRAMDRKPAPYQQRNHMVNGDTQQNDGHEEPNGSLEDLMKQFQQLLFHDSSSPTVSPKTSQQRSSAWQTSKLGFFEQQRQQQEPRQHIDTHFLSSASPGSPFMPRMNFLHSIASLDKALAAIPMNDKMEFLTALQVAPRLVARESDPMRFLVFHEYDAQRAAERLVYYWKIRHELFGDRAYLPMTMLSSVMGSDDAHGGGIEGALNAEDMDLLRSGFMVIVGTDREGSPVVLMDSSRRKAHATSARFRVFFYTYQVMSEYRTSQTPGLVVINVVRTNNLDKVSTKCTQMLIKTFPVKFKTIHSFDCMEKNNMFHRGFVQGLCSIIVRFFSLTKVHFYTSQCEQERERNVQILEEQHGLPRDLLPCSIGGTWTYEKFDEWLIQRTQEEKQSHLLNVLKNDRTLAIESNSINSRLVVAPNPMTWNQPLGSRSSSVPIAPEPQVDNGSASPVRIDVREIPEILQSLENATRHLTSHETKAFREALQSARSEIWEEECNFELFLRVENFDTRKSGERMAKYWQLRSQTFGIKQYDLMTQTGEGALGRQELKVLATGFLTLLPTDTNGQSILFVDLSRLSGNMDNSDRNRCLFYMMSLLTENEKSQTDGAILLHRVHPPDFAIIDVAFLEALVEALPLKLCRIHLVSHDNIPVDSVLSRIHCGGKVYIHSGTDKEELCSELELFGMKQADLPKFVNGDWGYEKFVQWQELRTRIEWKVPAGLSGRDWTEVANFPAMKPYTVLEDERERQRRLNLIHFRRRQNRDRLGIAALEENCIALRKERKKLLEENRELEKRYAAATAIVNSITSL